MYVRRNYYRYRRAYSAYKRRHPVSRARRSLRLHRRQIIVYLIKMAYKNNDLIWNNYMRPLSWAHTAYRVREAYLAYKASQKKKVGFPN